MIGDTICDIDGTVCDLTHRLHWIQGKPKNWRAFFANVRDDKPIQEVIDVVWLIMKKNLYSPRVVFCSGRPDHLRQDTIEWFNINMPWANRCKLYMRKSGDHRSDDIVKEELLHEIRNDGYDPKIAFDDRDRVVDMWRRNGIRTFQVARGDF